MKFEKLSLVDQIRYKRICKYYKKIDFAKLVENENMSLDIIKYLRANGFEDIFTGEVLSHSPNVTLQFIKENSFLDWNWEVCSYTCRSLKTMLSSKHLPWIRYYFSHSLDITLDDVVFHSDIQWDWAMLSRRLPFDVIQEHPDLPWNTRIMSRNPTLDVEYVCAHPDLEWNYTTMCSCNSNPEMVIKTQHIWNAGNKEMFWMYHVSSNPHVTIDLIKKMPNVEWNWNILSIYIDLKDIIANPQLPWDTGSFSWNRGLTLDYVISNKNINWVWSAVSGHAQFDYGEFSQHRKFKWNELSKNKWFLHVSDQELEQAAKRVFSANKIKRQFKEAISNPEYKLCKRRLMHEFEITSCL